MTFPPIQSPLQSIIAENTVLSGRLAGQNLCLLGRFTGEAAAQRMRVEATAQITANLKSEEAEVLGRFEGRIDAKVLRFCSTARARGVFFFDQLTIEEGALVDGSFNVEPASIGASVAMPVPSGGADGGLGPPSG